MENLSENQKFFAAALPIEPQTIEQIKKQANADGAFIERIQCQQLVDLGIAKHGANNAREFTLCRGPLWNEFDNNYGIEMATKGLSILKLIEKLDAFEFQGPNSCSRNRVSHRSSLRVKRSNPGDTARAGSRRFARDDGGTLDRTALAGAFYLPEL